MSHTLNLTFKNMNENQGTLSAKMDEIQKIIDYFNRRNILKHGRVVVTLSIYTQVSASSLIHISAQDGRVPFSFFIRVRVRLLTCSLFTLDARH